MVTRQNNREGRLSHSKNSRDIRGSASGKVKRACMCKTTRVKKNKHSKVFEVIVSGTHTGLGIESVHLSQIGKPQDSWGTIYYSTQKSLASVVGNK